MAKSNPVVFEDGVKQKPAVLVNKPGKELIDPLEKICLQLDEISRNVKKHYLTSMQKQIDLDDPKPTLAQRTRFNRLNKLNAILIELTDLTRNLNKWRSKHDSISEEVKKTVDKTIARLSHITTQISTIWNSLTDIISCLANCKSMERKVIEYHVGLEDFLEVLIRLTLRLQKNKEVVQLNNLPIVPDNLAKVEMSFPVKLSDHETIAKEIHGKSTKT